MDRSLFRAAALSSRENGPRAPARASRLLHRGEHVRRFERPAISRPHHSQQQADEVSAGERSASSAGAISSRYAALTSTVASSTSLSGLATSKRASIASSRSARSTSSMPISVRVGPADARPRSRTRARHRTARRDARSDLAGRSPGVAFVELVQMPRPGELLLGELLLLLTGASSKACHRTARRHQRPARAALASGALGLIRARVPIGSVSAR